MLILNWAHGEYFPFIEAIWLSLFCRQGVERQNYQQVILSILQVKLFTPAIVEVHQQTLNWIFHFGLLRAKKVARIVTKLSNKLPHCYRLWFHTVEMIDKKTGLGAPIYPRYSFQKIILVLFRRIRSISAFCLESLTKSGDVEVILQIVNKSPV